MIYTIILIAYGLFVGLSIISLILKTREYKKLTNPENSPFTEVGQKIIKLNEKSDLITFTIVVGIRVALFFVLFTFKDPIVAFIKQYL